MKFKFSNLQLFGTLTLRIALWSRRGLLSGFAVSEFKSTAGSEKGAFAGGTPICGARDLTEGSVVHATWCASGSNATHA